MNVLDWQRPKNMRPDYVPPLVAQRILTEVQFWDMAHANSKLRWAQAIAARNTREAHRQRVLSEYASARLVLCRQ